MDTRSFWDSAERRKEPRAHCFIQGRVVISREPSTYWVGEGTVLNLSSAGLLFQVNQLITSDGPVPPNSTVFVTLYFPTQTVEIRLEGDIRHWHQENKILFGINFQNLSGENEKIIRGYIAA